MATVEPIAEVKGDGSESSEDDELFSKEEGISDPREATNNDTTKDKSHEQSP